jgi:predicted TIM-barrel fold metal-dependent hydrolase
MQVVDGHHHLWDPRRLPYPWLAAGAPQPPFGDVSAIAGPYLPRDYADDAAGLDLVASVHVQADCAPAHALAETSWLAQMRADLGHPFAIVAHADPRRDDLAAVLTQHKQAGDIRGIRLRVNFDAPRGRRVIDDPEIFADPRFRSGLQTIGEMDLLFELSLFPGQMAQAASLCASVPETLFVLNHLGWPLDVSPTGFAEWRLGMRGLAACANVAVKISGLWPIDRAWSAAGLAPWVEETVALFGPSRCLYGSNLPIEKLMCPMASQVETLSQILSGLDSQGCRDIFAGTCRKLYRL